MHCIIQQPKPWTLNPQKLSIRQQASPCWAEAALVNRKQTTSSFMICWCCRKLSSVEVVMMEYTSGGLSGGEAAPALSMCHEHMHCMHIFHLRE